jgi:hypothetical protein
MIPYVHGLHVKIRKAFERKKEREKNGSASQSQPKKRAD